MALPRATFRASNLAAPNLNASIAGVGELSKAFGGLVDQANYNEKQAIAQKQYEDMYGLKLADESRKQSAEQRIIDKQNENALLGEILAKKTAPVMEQVTTTGPNVSVPAVRGGGLVSGILNVAEFTAVTSAEKLICAVDTTTLLVADKSELVSNPVSAFCTKVPPKVQVPPSAFATVISRGPSLVHLFPY